MKTMIITEIQFSTYVFLASESRRVDIKLDKQTKVEVADWTKALKRTIACVKFLAERGLAIRGSSKIFGRTDM